MAVASHRPGGEYRDDRWALYRLDEDFAEAADLSAQQPEKLRELIELWWAEAGKYGVLPLDGRENRGMEPNLPPTGKERERYVFYPATSPLPTLAVSPG